MNEPIPVGTVRRLANGHREIYKRCPDCGWSRFVLLMAHNREDGRCKPCSNLKRCREMRAAGKYP